MVLEIGLPPHPDDCPEKVAVIFLFNLHGNTAWIDASTALCIIFGCLLSLILIIHLLSRRQVVSWGPVNFVARKVRL
jgi:hypothetical protein